MLIFPRYEYASNNCCKEKQAFLRKEDLSGQKSSSLRSHLGHAVRIFVAIGAIFLVFRNEDLSHLIDILMGINPGIIFLGFLAYYIGQLMFVLRWRLILSVQAIHISVLAGLKLHFLGLFYNNCLPSSVGGDVLRAWYVTHHCPRDKRLEAALSVLVDRFVGLSGMIIMALAAWWLVPVPAQENTAESAGNSQTSGFFEKIVEYRYFIISAICIFAGMVVVFLLIPKGRRAVKKIYSLIREKFHAFFLKTVTALKLYLKKPFTVLCAYLLSFLCQAFPILGLYFIGKDIGLDAHIKYYYVLFPVSWMLGAVPISIGGIGIMEGWVKIMFAKVSAANEAKSAVIAICQRIIWLVGSLPGVVIHISGAHLPRSEALKEEFFVDDVRKAD